METEGGGWTLVGSWYTASEWTKNSVSVSSSFLKTPKNAFSSNFGDQYMNDFRVTASNEINGGTNADFYYHYNNPIKWKTVWAPSGGKNKGYMSTTPRQSLKKFNYAYNLKYMKKINQIYANLSDWGHKSNYFGNTADWWSGLTKPGITLGIYNMSKYYENSDDVSDGTFGLSASNRSDNSGQDAEFNVKIGWDDGQRFQRYGNGNSTNNYSQQDSGVDAESKLWLWIR